MSDLVTMLSELLAQSRQNQIEKSTAPAQATMEQIQVTGQRPQAEQPNPLQMFLTPPQMPGMGGLSGATPGMGPQSLNPMFKQGKDPSIGDLKAMMAGK